MSNLIHNDSSSVVSYFLQNSFLQNLFAQNPFTKMSAVSQAVSPTMPPTAPGAPRPNRTRRVGRVGGARNLEEEFAANDATPNAIAPNAPFVRRISAMTNRAYNAGAQACALFMPQEM